MASSPIEMKIEVQSIEKVKTIIELLHSYKEALPKELINSLEDLSDCECCEIDSQYWIRTYGGQFTCEPHIEEVVSINIILKRVTFNNGEVICDKKLDHFKAYSDGKLVIEW